MSDQPSDDTPIRVLIVDDHAVVRSGLRRVLDAEVGIEVVGEAGDAKNALFQTRETKPDVILLDVVMPGKTGIEAIPDILHDAPDTKVLILSMQDDPRYVREAFDAGASGYVLKEAVDTDVVAAVRDVAAGGHYVHPALGARMLAADAEERKRADQDPLSDRERDVLRLVAKGEPTRRIAGQLGISRETVETHIRAGMRKLGARTRTEAAALAMEALSLEGDA
jgi:DNA-binding NarL/FixJ family response regulator